MKYILSVLVALSVLCGPAISAEEPVSLVLVAGQSNAVGFDAKPSELSADAGDKDVLFWWRCGDPPPDEYDTTSGGKWTWLQAQPRGNPKQTKEPRQYGNFAQTEGGFGPEIGFARDLRAKEGKRLAIVKVAFSGTAMATDWDPVDSSNDASCYRVLVSETKAAIAAAKAADIPLRLRALVWVQGESDANAKSAPLYEKALTGMIAALRKDLDAPTMVALVGVNAQFGGGKNTFMPAIVAAQKALAGKDPRSAYVDTSSAAIANTVHFSAAGTLDVGRMFAEELLKVDARIAETAAINEKFAAWKAALSSEHQAWETVLETNLGSFYLPIYKREKTEGKETAWDYVRDEPKLPRVLLIGDSVSRAYTLPVRHALAGKANVHRAPENCGPSANGLKKLEIYLGDGHWDVIHFNFGIHDRATPPEKYAQNLEQIIARLEKTGAKLIWARTTPPPPNNSPKFTLRQGEQVNRVADEVMRRHGIAIDDLYGAVFPRLAELQIEDDVHFKAEGYDLMGQRVVSALLTQLQRPAR